MSTEKLVALLIVLIVIYLFYLKYEKSQYPPIEKVEDYRPKVYLLTSEWNCENCDQLIRRFLYTVGRSDGYIAVTPGEAREEELRQQYKLHDENPVLIVESHGKPGEVTRGNLSITLTLDGMVAP